MINLPRFQRNKGHIIIITFIKKKADFNFITFFTEAIPSNLSIGQMIFLQASRPFAQTIFPRADRSKK